MNAIRVCELGDIECSHGCGTGACKREHSTENSRVDVLTAALNLLRETQKNPPNYEWTLRRDSFLQNLAASPVEQPAAAPINRCLHPSWNSIGPDQERCQKCGAMGSERRFLKVDSVDEDAMAISDAMRIDEDGSIREVCAPAPADERVGLTDEFENWWKSLDGTHHRHDEFYVGADGDWIHRNDVEDIWKTLRGNKTS